MKIRKTVGLTLALVLALCMLSGCHGTLTTKATIGAGDTDVPAQFDETRPIELVFWAKNDTNKVQTAVYTQAIEDFEKLYPNVKISLRLYSDYSRIYADVITNIATNTPPNVCITYPDHIATYKTGSDVVLQMDDWMSDSRYGLGGSELKFDAPAKEEIVPEFLDECLLDGHYYAMPYMRSTEALYINRDLVEKLGYQVPDVLTWDFVWEVSEKAMEKNADGTFAVNGQNVMIPFIYKSTDNMMITMLKQLDAPYSGMNGEVQIFNDTTRELLQESIVITGSFVFSCIAASARPNASQKSRRCRALSIHSNSRYAPTPSSSPTEITPGTRIAPVSRIAPSPSASAWKKAGEAARLAFMKTRVPSVSVRRYASLMSPPETGAMPAG